MSGRDFGEGCSSSSAQVSGSKRRKVVHPLPRLSDSLYEFHKPEGDPSMQIVFVHGIHAEDAVDAHLSTWESEDGFFFWPQRWLAEEFPRAHIFTAKYIGGIGKSSHGKFDSYQIAENLLSDLMGEKVGQISFCPVVLVGHCFGGIVIKQLCLHASKPSKNPNQRKAFIENLRGIFFYSTPHRGLPSLSEQADLFQTPLLGDLKTLSERAARVNFEFSNLPESDANWRIHSIGELLPTKSTLFPGVVAVPEASAREGDVFNTVAADHTSISKPASKTDKRFSALKNLLHEVASTSEEEARVCKQTSMEDSRPENFQRLPKEMIDMQVQVKEIVDKLESVRILGFCGMGGLGKTTLAKAVFNELNKKFEYSCFVSDAKLITGREDDVRKELWECLHFRGKKVGGQCHLAVLRGKRLLLVLDDVSDRDSKVLCDLAEDTDLGSRFISTSRETDRLNDLGEVFTVPYLDWDSAILLFRRHAFGDGSLPCSEMKSILEDIVTRCGGLPLALEVVGKYLRGKKKQEVWKQTLIALEKAEKVKTLNEKLWAKLRISFDNLGEEEQQVFLDATNFFVGIRDWTLAEAKAAWTVAYETGGELLWQTLLDMSLVDNVKDNDHMRVHEQLQSLGRMIASEPKNRGKYVIFGREEAPTTLEETLAANGQDCHALRLVSRSVSRGVIYISSEAFHKLRNLRFLEVEREVVIDGASSTAVHQRTNLEVPTKLVLLKCVGHSLFNPSLQKKLAILDVENLENIPSSIGQLSRLKRLRINCIRQLSRLKRLTRKCSRDVGRALDRRIDVEHATSSSLPESFRQLTVLEHLILDRCTLLRSLPESFGQLKALQLLEFNECRSLRSLPESFGQLKALQHLEFIECHSLRSLPESFGQLKALQHLKFDCCDSLQNLPESFGQLKALQHLEFRMCRSLQSLLESFGQLRALQHLEFSHSISLQNLPESFGQLRALKVLRFQRCDSLETLPTTLGQLSALERLKVFDCRKLKCLPHSVGQLSNLKYFTLNKIGIESLPDSMGQLSALIQLSVAADDLQSLPDSFGRLSALTELSVEAIELQSLPDSFGQLSALTKLSISADKLQSLPDTFGHLSALTELSVKASSMQSLADSIGQLSGLTRLSLSNCRKLKSLPESFGKLSSLSQVQLINCNQLCNLPKSSGQLTKLQCLSFECLSFGSKQERWKQRGAESREERVPKKLRTLPNRLGNLPNLQYLQLWGFSAASIPDSVRGMPSLRYVEIMNAKRVDKPWPVWLVDKTDPNTTRPVGSIQIFQIFQVCDGRLFLVEEDRILGTSTYRQPGGFERPGSTKTILHGIGDI